MKTRQFVPFHKNCQAVITIPVYVFKKKNTCCSTNKKPSCIIGHTRLHYRKSSQLNAGSYTIAKGAKKIYRPIAYEKPCKQKHSQDIAESQCTAFSSHSMRHPLYVHQATFYRNLMFFSCYFLSIRAVKILF